MNHGGNTQAVAPMDPNSIEVINNLLRLLFLLSLKFSNLQIYLVFICKWKFVHWFNFCELNLFILVCSRFNLVDMKVMLVVSSPL